MSLFAQVRDYVDSLVHPSARRDALEAARHRVFIAPRLIGGLMAVAALPLYLAMRGVPSMLEGFVLAWLVAPVLIAVFLSRTGRYDAAHVLSSVSLIGLVAAVATETGGIASFMAVWLAIVPLEAALSASRRVVIAVSAIALLAVALLFGLGHVGLLAPVHAGADATMLAALGLTSALLYAAGLALGAVSLARTSSRLLGAEEDRYRLLARNMTDVIVRHGRNGAVKFASPAAEAVFGVPPRRLLGHGIFDRVHVADRPAYLTALAEAARGADRGLEFRIRHESDEGPAFVWVEMRCRPLDAEGASRDPEHRELVAVIREVTERKLQEQAVEAARNEAERANAEKTRFLATMSHELRTPLNAIIGFSDMLANEELMQLDAARRQEYAKLIGDSGLHLLSVVNGILDMSKIESGNFEITPEPFPPAPVVGACCDMMALRAQEAGIELVCRVDASLPEIVADKRAVKQVLINLLSNAIKFTGRDGRITVSAQADRDTMTFTVEDTGIGIGEADLARVGDPFFQVRTAYDRPHDGTGLGLSIVRGLVGLHGGRLELTSRVGAGTRVVVTLPLDCEKGGSVEPPSTVARLPVAPADAGPPDIKVKKRA
ncbi:MAG: PAS domain-containing sensor histidine kinase [Bradyrhizobiaceae bacterium]|nr:MAG: PAS domain-containing sensor histidine kinase [Bradyrhizobiaceae bacterium]